MRFSSNQLKMLRFLYDHRLAEPGVSGAQMSKATKIGAGSTYPFLTKLVNEGMASSKWEEIDPREAGRPRRRYFRLTGLGIGNAQNALADFQIADQKVGGVPEPGGGFVYD